MTPKEKAKELYFKMHSQEQIVSKEAKQCALIAVGEVIYAIDWHNIEIGHENFEYWWEVKKEIEAL